LMPHSYLAGDSSDSVKKFHCCRCYIGFSWKVRRIDACSTGGMDTSRLNNLTHLIIEAAIHVHRVLGPGLLESIYRACLIHELHKRGLSIVIEQLVPIVYDGVVLEGAYRLDLLVENTIVVEVKSVETILPVHRAQLLSYVRLTGKSVGLLINFNVPILFKGVKRVMNGAPESALRDSSSLPNQ
jgi:GxxExxY protein